MVDKRQNELDRMLDTALAKYAAAEPRPGLEDRVLAHLRAEHTRIPVHGWWPWSVAAVLAVIIVAVALALRSGESSHPVVTNHPALATQSPNQPATQVASNGEGSGIRPPEASAVRKAVPQGTHPHFPIAVQPKLDQFPSPQPLSEQEKILANYVAEYPEHAVLIARARSEELRRDAEEELEAGTEAATGR